jgi:Domain of unknown function (DUF4440)
MAFKPTAEFTREVENLEKRESDARLRADVDALDRLWSDDLIINATENIIFTKSHFLLRVKSGRVRFKSFERIISRFTSRGDILITSGNESMVPANGPDEKKTVFCSYMNTWIYSERRWQLIGRKVSVLARTPSNSRWVF